MRDKYGIVLLDKTEIIIKVYEKDISCTPKKIYDKQYEKAAFSSPEELTVSEVIELIAQTALTPEAINVSDWRICAREVPEVTVSEISHITNIKAEILTLSREQDLICKAVAGEL
jgi:hypothetical protein